MVNFCAMQGRARASITKKLTSVRRSIIPIPFLEYEFAQVTRGDRHRRNQPQALGWMPDSPRAETLTTSQTPAAPDACAPASADMPYKPRRAD